MSTSEWYEFNGDSMLITERHEPENQMVKSLGKDWFQAGRWIANLRRLSAFYAWHLIRLCFQLKDIGIMRLVSEKAIESDEQTLMLKEAANELAVNGCRI